MSAQITYPEFAKAFMALQDYLHLKRWGVAEEMGLEPYTITKITKGASIKPDTVQRVFDWALSKKDVAVPEYRDLVRKMIRAHQEDWRVFLGTLDTFSLLGGAPPEAPLTLEQLLKDVCFEDSMTLRALGRRMKSDPKVKSLVYQLTDLLRL